MLSAAAIATPRYAVERRERLLSFPGRRYIASTLRNHSAKLVRLHLKLGWTWILVFSLLGLLLEGLHGFKVGLYLDVSHEARRLMWSLAHAHGTLLGLVSIAFAVSLPHLASASGARFASRMLIASSVLLPAGFFLGGLVIYSGDPGPGVLLVPAGALALAAGAAAVLRALDG